MTLLQRTERRRPARAERPSRQASPETAGRRAFLRFCTPHLSSHRTADHEQLVQRARFHLRSARTQRLATAAGEVQTYLLEPDGPALASVLLVHGWTGEASFMSVFAEHLRRRGFRVVLVDLPAHGLSGGRHTSLMDCARAVIDVADAHGPIRFALGHSIGGLAALLAGEGRAPMPRSYPFDAYVLIAMPDRFADVTARFGAELGLSPPALRDFERRLELIARRRIADFQGSKLLAATGRPALVVHCRDDAEVGFDCAERVAAASPAGRLLGCDGLGHRMILYAPPVVRAASAYLAERVG